MSVAGLVAEVKLAGYPAGYVEVDVAGRTSIAWDAVRVARIEAGLPICGHKDCEIPVADAGPDSAGPDSVEEDARRIAGHITGEDVAEVIGRAEDEVFDLLKSNWPSVERVVDALCKQDRLTTAELDVLIAGPDSAEPSISEPGTSDCGVGAVFRTVARIASPVPARLLSGLDSQWTANMAKTGS
jgi:hypothetical protein